MRLKIEKYPKRACIGGGFGPVSESQMRFCVSESQMRFYIFHMLNKNKVLWISYKVFSFTQIFQLFYTDALYREKVLLEAIQKLFQFLKEKLIIGEVVDFFVGRKYVSTNCFLSRKLNELSRLIWFVVN